MLSQLEHMIIKITFLRRRNEKKKINNILLFLFYNSFNVYTQIKKFYLIM